MVLMPVLMYFIFCSSSKRVPHAFGITSYSFSDEDKESHWGWAEVSWQ